MDKKIKEKEKAIDPKEMTSCEATVIMLEKEIYD